MLVIKFAKTSMIIKRVKSFPENTSMIHDNNFFLIIKQKYNQIFLTSLHDLYENKISKDIRTVSKLKVQQRSTNKNVL